MAPQRILIVRLGAMGDVIHAIPAVSALRRTFPQADIAWAIHPKWSELIEGGVAARPIFVNRRDRSSLIASLRDLRAEPFDSIIDFQGLIQSALVARAARGERILGFDSSQVRERPAALFYTERLRATGVHVVDRNLELAALAGALPGPVEWPLPSGMPEGELPQTPFVLASPLAGWKSKQWPLENYGVLAHRLKEELGVALVLNGAPFQAETLRGCTGVKVHLSSISGLIDATRRASSILGLDSGPLHLAAAFGKPGVALFGPTDPARNGPYSDSIRVLRAAKPLTSYQRGDEIDPSMRELTPDEVFGALRDCLTHASPVRS